MSSVKGIVQQWKSAKSAFANIAANLLAASFGFAIRIRNAVDVSRCQMENMSPIYSCENFTKPKRVKSVIVKQKKYPPIQEMLDQILTKLTNIEEKMSEK